MSLADSSNGVYPPSLFLMANTFETGGGERQFATIAGNLNPQHLQVRLGCLRKRGPFAEGLHGVVEFPPEGSLFKLRSQRARWQLGRYLRANRVLIAHSFDFYSNFMMIPSARLAGVPVVLASQRQLGDLMSRFRNVAQHALFRFCDRVVCNSRAAASGLQQAGISPHKLVVIGNALPGEIFAEQQPALPLVQGALRVVMIARMNDPAKRHDIFLKAAARLSSRHPKIEFVLVGDGPLRPGLEEMAAKLGLGNRVTFLGDRRDVSAILASADISVLPSISESLSNAIMESMAAGVPVVACRIGGNEELIRDGESGFLVQAGSDEDLAARVESLVDQPGLRKSFGAAAKRNAQNFSVEKICEQYERLYMSLLEEKGMGKAVLAKSPLERGV